MRSNAALNRIFNQYNRQMFGNELSPNVCIYWKEMRGLGYSLKYADDSYEIALNEATHSWPKVWRVTLVHEMLHLYLPKRVFHGEKFQQGMLKLIVENPSLLRLL